MVPLLAPAGRLNDALLTFLLNLYDAEKVCRPLFSLFCFLMWKKEDSALRLVSEAFLDKEVNPRRCCMVQALERCTFAI